VVRSRVVSSVFYGYPAEVVADWCGVSVETARRWKNGQRKPSPSSLKLFALYRDRKVLGKEWSGWIVKQGVIVDPESNETTQGQLRAYFQVYQLAHVLARGDSTEATQLALLLSAG
jgi:transcriptional regulator with XRE-family HTH domain